MAQQKVNENFLSNNIFRKQCKSRPDCIVDENERGLNIIRVKSVMTYDIEDQHKNKSQIHYGVKIFTEDGFEDLNILARGYAIIRGFQNTF